MAAARKSFRGGRPLKPKPCPHCGASCRSATEAAAHCVGRSVRNREAAETPAAALPQVSPLLPSQQYPTWKYHPTKRAVIVKDAQAEVALGEGWTDSPV